VAGGLITVAGSVVIGAALRGFRRYRREPAGAGDEAPSGTAAAGQ
jgi:hypothetical protein